MVVGGTQEAGANVFAAGGARMTSGFTLSWRSSNSGVLTVDPRGTVRGSGAGSAWLVASAGNARDSVLVSVEALPSAVEIAGGDFRLEVGDSRALAAAVVDSDGGRMEREVRWTSSNPAVLVVDATTGRVTASASGAAQITAAVDGFSDQVTVTVEAPAPALPTGSTIQTALSGYVAALSGGDEDGVRRTWGSGDEGRLDDLIDLMGEREFSAALGTIGDPTDQGGAAVVPFAVTASYRNFAGGGRESSLNFLARFERVGSDWRLVSAFTR
jgi:hypothetical protein